MKPKRNVVHGPLLLALCVALGCAGGMPAPEDLDLHNDSCAWCRMAISDHRLAAQLVAPNEEPKFFDEIGCLRDYLAAQTSLPSGAVAYVADHRSGEWLRADQATYHRATGLETPMGSRLIAHRNVLAWREDPQAKGSVPVEMHELFGPKGPPAGGN